VCRGSVKSSAWVAEPRGSGGRSGAGGGEDKGAHMVHQVGVPEVRQGRDQLAGAPSAPSLSHPNYSSLQVPRPFPKRLLACFSTPSLALFPSPPPLATTPNTPSDSPLSTLRKPSLSPPPLS